MYAEISSAIASAKIALEIAKSASTLTNFNELVAAISEVNTKLMDATAIALASQEKQSALSNRVSELENQLREIKDWESKIDKYQLHEFKTRALAYISKQIVGSNEPIHYLCTTCVSKRQATILQPKDNFLYCSLNFRSCRKYLSLCR